jgi:hypothetical protein
MLFPFLALTLRILNGYFISGIIFTELLIDAPDSPESLSLDGEMVANFSTNPVTFRLKFLLSGSFVSTRTVLASVLPP